MAIMSGGQVLIRSLGGHYHITANDIERFYREPDGSGYTCDGSSPNHKAARDGDEPASWCLITKVNGSSLWVCDACKQELGTDLALSLNNLRDRVTRLVIDTTAMRNRRERLNA